MGKSLIYYILGILLFSFWFYNLRKAKSETNKAEKEGEDLLQYFRNNSFDVKKILGEMRFIAEENFKLYDEYRSNKGKGFFVMRKQDKLIIAMNHNVKAEWVPRIKFLEEIQNSFDKDCNLYNAFIEYKKLDNSMRKLTIWGINKINAREEFERNAKIALTCVAIGTIAMIAVAGVVVSSANKAAKDIGYSPKSNARYRDPETGNLFDEDGNRVPW